VKVLAADIGFGYTKTTDGRQSQIFKSVLGEANEAPFTEALMSAQKQHPRHFKLGEESFFVGDLAESQSRGRQFTLDPQQFLSKYAKQLAIAGLCPFAPDGEPIRLVTGLPISFFRRYRDAISALLKGRHALTAIHPDGRREEKQVYIEQVRVVPQPFGSLFNLMLNDLGKPASQRFLTQKIGIVDVGFRTADFTISDRSRYSERGSVSTDAGISSAYTQVATWLQEKSGITVELFRLYEAVARGSIKIKGKSYDIGPVVQQAFQQLAQRIASDANRLWSDDWDIDAIVITGGGGQVLAPMLAPQLEGEVLPVPADTDIRLANVTGYHKYGVHLWGDGNSASASGTAG